ncbi:sensor histidine kinase [Sanguibacter sp. A247]|uniref:sensor histidine kinase n=1 Tax=unclassified Sanguibacter TaxID=2645534 RepID=UPI003FD8DBB6
MPPTPPASPATRLRRAAQLVLPARVALLVQRPGVRDGLLALVLVGLGLVPTASTIGVVLGDLPERPWDALGVALLVAQCAPLAVRRRWPGACLALVGLAVAADELLAYPPTFASVSLYVALYTAGAFLARGRRGVGAGATAGYGALAVALTSLGSPSRPADFVAFYLVLVIMWLAGAGVRRWRAEAAERQRLAAAIATSDERARIARELHDVVTHHVTAMVVQAEAAQYLLPDGSDRAADGLTAISGTGRRALTELRYLLGVLGSADGPDAGTLRPTLRPTLGRVTDLIDEARAAGQSVQLVDGGEWLPLPDAVELTAYRVVQEGLTNALKHSPGRAITVTLRHGATSVDIDVTTDGSAASGRGGPVAAAPLPSGGLGIAGLRERVRLLDGTLEAGPTREGGFRLHARIPSASEDS